MGEANSYKIKLLHVHRMDRSRLVQVVANYQQAGRLLDWYIETGTDHEAEVLESVTTTTTTMVMMMMMMMQTTTTTIMVVVVVLGIMVVTVTETLTWGRKYFHKCI